MPVYLLHGFRWPRPLIRIHIILQNLDNAAAEWLVAPPTTLALLKNFTKLYPESMGHLHRLRFVEQYDPSDTSPSAASQPFAYVADMVEEVRLGVDIDEVRGRGVGNDQWGALMELRDKLAPEEKVAWYIVVCGDEERWAPPTLSVLQGAGHNHTRSARGSETESQSTYNTSRDTSSQEEEPRGLKKLFVSVRSLGKRKSRTSVKEIQREDSSKYIPSLHREERPVPSPDSASAAPAPNVNGTYSGNGNGMNGNNYTSPSASHFPPPISNGHRKSVASPVARFSNSPRTTSPEMTRAMSPEHRRIVGPQSTSLQLRSTVMSPSMISPDASFDQTRSTHMQAMATGTAISPILQGKVNGHERTTSDQSVRPEQLLAHTMFEGDSVFVTR